MDPSTQLTGKALLDRVKQLIREGHNLSACARQTGYSSTSPTGVEIPQASPFMKALLEATGIVFPAGKRGPGGGRRASDRCNVMSNSTVLISRGKLSATGLVPGDEVSIEFDETSRTFTLNKLLGNQPADPSEAPSKEDW